MRSHRVIEFQLHAKRHPQRIGYGFNCWHGNHGVSLYRLLRISASVQALPPYPVARAVLTFGTWRFPALPITCNAASATRIIAVAPIGFVLSTPPEGFTGSSPSMLVTP